MEIDVNDTYILYIITYLKASKWDMGGSVYFSLVLVPLIVSDIALQVTLVRADVNLTFT